MNIFDLIIGQPIFNLLIAIYGLIPGGDFGLALIVFTILVRLALWPLVVRQLHQTKIMRKLRPEMKKIKQETKGNRQLEGVMMLELYKKYNYRPFQSFLVLIIQLPIFFAIFSAVRIITNGRDQIASHVYPFLEGLPQVHNLIINPDAFNEKLFGFLDLTQHAVGSDGINIFLILLAALSAFMQYISSRQVTPVTKTRKLREVLAEASSGKQADQSEMSEIMSANMIKFMPILMFFIMISLPGALALYYAVSNIFGVIQQHFILKRDEEELEQIAEEPDKKSKATNKDNKAKNRADKAIEAEVVKTPGSSKTKITRISASDSKRKK